MNREIPWYDSHTNAKRSISNYDFLVGVFLNNFLLQLDLSKLSEPMDAGLNFLHGKIDLHHLS